MIYWSNLKWFNHLSKGAAMIASLYHPKSEMPSDPIFSEFFRDPFLFIDLSRLVPPGARQFVDTGNSWDEDMPSAGKTSSNSKVDIARVHGCWIVWILEWMRINRSMGIPGSCEKPLHSSGHIGVSYASNKRLGITRGIISRNFQNWWPGYRATLDFLDVTYLLKKRKTKLTCEWLVNWRKVLQAEHREKKMHCQ